MVLTAEQLANTPDEGRVAARLPSRRLKELQLAHRADGGKLGRRAVRQSGASSSCRLWKIRRGSAEPHRVVHWSALSMVTDARRAQEELHTAPHRPIFHSAPEKYPEN